MKPDRSILLAATLALVAVTCWSGNWVLGRSIRATIPPLGLNFWRWSLAAVILAPLALPGLRGHWPLIRSHGKVLFGLSLTGAAMFQSMVYIGLHSTQAINALLLNATAPLFVMLIALVIRAETISARQYLGIAISFLGAGFIVLHGDLSALSSLALNHGDAWILSALVVWGIYSVLLRARPPGLPAVTLVFVISVIGAGVMLPFYLWELSQGQMVVFDRPTLWSILYVGLFASVVAFLSFNAAVSRLGPTLGVSFLHFMPVTGAILSVIFLGERIAAYHLIGFAIVLAGIGLATLSRPSHAGGKP